MSENNGKTNGRDPYEWHLRFRPKMFKHLVGQDDAVKILSAFLKKDEVPHFLLLTGPSGVGKTTIARILKNKLDCHDHDFYEINAAETRGIDTIRDIQSAMRLSPFGGAHKIWLVDESHKLTHDASTALLKMLEDTPRHVYFILCTTDPQKLLPTIRTRATEIRLQAVPKKTLCELVARCVETYFGGDSTKYPPDEVIERIAELADGSPRKALVLAGQIVDLASASEQLAVLEKSDPRRNAIELCRLLTARGKTRWKDVADFLNACDENPESLRRSVMGYALTILLKGGPLAARAAGIMGRFESPFYDESKAQLALACWDLCQDQS